MSMGSGKCRAASVALLAFGLATEVGDASEQGEKGSARTAAQIDVTGYWVSVITQDWLYRMVIPSKGDRGSIPLNTLGLEVAQAWDQGRDAAAGEPCRAYGAPGVMRRPGRLHIHWENENTLRIDSEAGSQIRRLHFADFLPPAGFGTTEPPLRLLRAALTVSAPASLQGYSTAAWNKVTQIRGLSIVGLNTIPTPTPGEGGGLIAITTRLQPGYLQQNGIPYSAEAVLTEYFNRVRIPRGDDYLIVSSIVDDPTYLSEQYVTTSMFKLERDASRWAPTACEE